MSARVLVPEILDHLDPSDPEARRSRADLRRLDLFLGNSRWILRALREQRPRLGSIAELGAGEGILCRRIFQEHPGFPVSGLDFAPRPPNLSPRVTWRQGDFFATLPALEPDVIVGSLILHHFPDGKLRDLGAVLKNARLLIFSEPMRSRVPLVCSYAAFPFVGRVTRHDMPASIRAGFRAGELSRSLGLTESGWQVHETCHWRGVVRMVGWRD